MLLFNWVGFRLLSDLMEKQSSLRLEAKLDNNNYEESDLIEITVPLDLPYQTNWSEFERFDGEIEFEGVQYKYVKRKVVDGKLVLLCLPHREKMNLQTARDDFFRLVNDLQHPGKSTESKAPNSALVKSFVTDYWQQNNQWNLTACSESELQFLIRQEYYIHSESIEPPTQPPDILG